MAKKRITPHFENIFLFIEFEDCLHRLHKKGMPFELIAILATPVKDLQGLSLVAKNAIYKTIGKDKDTILLKVIKHTRKDYSRIIQNGEVRVKEIEDFLHSHGLDFKPERAE